MLDDATRRLELFTRNRNPVVSMAQSLDGRTVGTRLCKALTKVADGIYARSETGRPGIIELRGTAFKNFDDCIVVSGIDNGNGKFSAGKFAEGYDEGLAAFRHKKKFAETLLSDELRGAVDRVNRVIRYFLGKWADEFSGGDCDFAGMIEYDTKNIRLGVRQ